eukprot:TRINITY_DN9191_c0_g2_i1.p1 TRINITY_DN9191_c0_g2~~TRINITY_DN9191_c0_g2_i1.p1  ORF type:complete len:662 (-),score=173.48 TRINITY_DN9191_c0_g2_i1:18-2003(-)
MAPTMDLLIATSDVDDARANVRRYTQQVLYRDALFIVILVLFFVVYLTIVGGTLYFVLVCFAVLCAYILVLVLFGYLSWAVVRPKKPLGRLALALCIGARIIQILAWFVDLLLVLNLLLSLHGLPEDLSDRERRRIQLETTSTIIADGTIFLLLYIVVLGPSVMYLRGAIHLRGLLIKRGRVGGAEKRHSTKIARESLPLLSAVSGASIEEGAGVGQQDHMHRCIGNDNDDTAGEFVDAREESIRVTEPRDVRGVDEGAVGGTSGEQGGVDGDGGGEHESCDEAPEKRVVVDEGHVDWYNVGECSLELVERFAREQELPLCTGEEAEECRGMRERELPEYLLHLWSHDAWYRPLNLIITERCVEFYPLIKCMVYGLTNCRIGAKYLYRGMNNVRVDQSKAFYRFYTFSATTTSIETAKRFGTDVVFVIEVNRHTLGGSIEHLSYFQNEDEVLLVPFQQFAVQQRKEVGGRLWVYMAAEGLAEVEEAEVEEGDAGELVEYHDSVEVFVAMVLHGYSLWVIARKLCIIPYLIAVGDYNTELQDFCRFEYTRTSWVTRTSWGDLRSQYRHLNRFTATLKYLSGLWLLLYVSFFYVWLPTSYFGKANMARMPFISSMPPFMIALLAWMQRHSLLFRIMLTIFCVTFLIESALISVYALIYVISLD